MAKNNKKQSKTDTQFSANFIQGYNRSINGVRTNTFQIRALAKSNNLVAVAKSKVIQKIIKVPFVIRAKDKNDQQKLQPYIDNINNLLLRPNRTTNFDTWRKLVTAMMNDVLDFDQGTIEKVRNLKGEIKELYYIDGATIFSMFDDYGEFDKVAYKQYVFSDFTQPTQSANADAEFTKDDLLIFQMDPQGAYGMLGRGYSPVEKVIHTVIASLNAMLYNSNYFDEAKLPPYVMNLKGVQTPELQRFKADFERQMAIGSHTNLITNAENMSFQALRPSNQDMQFYELNLWLARIVLSSFGLSPEEFGLTMDSNKANSQVQHKMSKTAGLEPYLDLIKEEINVSVIQDLAENVDANYGLIEFDWNEIDNVDELTRAQVDQIYVGMGKTLVNELRQRDGQDPIEGGDTPNFAQQQPQQGFDFNNMKPDNTSNTFKSAKKSWLEFYK
jgi:HK97 family phage portal protein